MLTVTSTYLGMLLVWFGTKRQKESLAVDQKFVFLIALLDLTAFSFLTLGLFFVGSGVDFLPSFNFNQILFI